MTRNRRRRSRLQRLRSWARHSTNGEIAGTVFGVVLALGAAGSLVLYALQK